MKRMLLGVFLMLCSNWCLLFAVMSLMEVFLGASLLLALAAAVCFISGLAAKTPKEQGQEH